MSESNEFADEKCRSASGSEVAWSVEARSAEEGRPVVLGDGAVFTSTWQVVPLEKIIGGHGVPAGKAVWDTYLAFGLMSYPAAQAMRWWFMALLHEAHQDTLIETRLVKHQVRYQRSAQRVAATHHVSGWDVIRGKDEHQEPTHEH